MEELESLKKIGAKEISKHTHMALNKISSILECDYAELKDRATTIGLIKILEREYEVNLEKWLSEYDEYWNSHEKDEEELEKLINFKVTHEATQQKDSTGFVVIATILAVIIGVGFYVYFNFSNVATNLDNQIQELEVKTIAPKESNKTGALDSNVSLEVERQITDINSTIPVTTTLDSSASTPINEEPKTEEKAENKLTLKPLENVWVGIIYLDTKEKTSLVTNEPLEIDTKREQTIITGHGMIEIATKNKTLGSKMADRMRFYVDSTGEIKEITSAEYNKYNGGIGW
ncbi:MULTISPECIES: hypothetical protein [Helicobacter]|uniref:Sialidase A n=1 Tax=Helicobacter ibis TaxID=2962633 RepID=A0ABT4VE33_9HELI|nr:MULTISPECIES: hypothetical protein [Helicobacter]MDA3966770.1 hypothetical protein [Helicobacter sp. WB40]MDA3968448.1 hypothetical protein [Helicobacter ibis]